MKLDIIPGTDLKIRQNKDEFSYGIDAIILSSYVRPRRKMIDLGTGTGIIPLRLVGMYQDKIDKIYGIEIQENVYDLARENVRLNKLEEKIRIENLDIKKLDKSFDKAVFDTVVSNPPYMKKDAAIVNEKDNFAISRHEIMCDIEDIIKTSDYLLKPLGELYLIHRPNRLVDIFYYMRKYGIEPKNIRMVKPSLGKKPNLLLIRGVKHANIELEVEKELIVYDEKGNYKEEIYDIYKKNWRSKNGK